METDEMYDFVRDNSVESDSHVRLEAPAIEVKVPSEVDNTSSHAKGHRFPPLESVVSTPWTLEHSPTQSQISGELSNLDGNISDLHEL